MGTIAWQELWKRKESVPRSVAGVSISTASGNFKGLHPATGAVPHKNIKNESAKKKGGAKNIQQQVFAGGHPPNY